MKKKKNNLTPSISKIIFRNIITLFNIVLVFIAVVLFLVGAYKNILFLGVVISNAFMGAFQEIKAKRALDRLQVLAQAKLTALRDGVEVVVTADDIVLEDVILLKAGNQIITDGIVIESEHLELDESLLTGEADRVHKTAGDTLMSGSYVTSGSARMQVTALPEDSYAQSLTSEAKSSKREKPILIRTLSRLIFLLTFVMLPLGIILFLTQFYADHLTLKQAVLGTSASMLGMIPSGLVLLTGVTMTVGAFKLANNKALVQSLPSIETLARSDVLCLDKTGTITDGTLVFDRMITTSEESEQEVGHILREILGVLPDQNATATILRETYGSSIEWDCIDYVPFSSERKWSGVQYEAGTYILGAPGILKEHVQQNELMEQANQYAKEGYRVLFITKTNQALSNECLPGQLTCMAFLLITDRIRDNAFDTFAYFAQEEVTLKVISGDNPYTVRAVAMKAGIANADQVLDMTTVGEDADYAELSETYTVFGHVTPHQKRELVRGLKRNDHTVCMTGDGVNDILAMRESNCSVVMVAGSDAARSAGDFILMSDDFTSMIDVLREGRQVINNMEIAASVFLLKTLYSILLTLIYIPMPYAFPMIPIQMMPINALTVAGPSFFLAMLPNYVRPSNRLFRNFIEYTVPGSITVVIATLYFQYVSVRFQISYSDMTTMVVFFIGLMGFGVLIRVGKIRNNLILLMYIIMITAYVLSFTLPFAANLFSLTGMLSSNVMFYLPMIAMSYVLYRLIGWGLSKFLDKNKHTVLGKWLKL